MDDSCAVCAESLQWVAYGACGHKEVCSTCVARLRFICDDRRCCICKTESAVVFVTKALGDYTKTINDFSLLPSEGKEGRVGKYWYHEDTQAFFDDSDHYKMIKAMCRLSCSECDRMEDQSDDASRKRVKFRNIEHLKGHLFHKHRLLMCSLCLEGRKVFICEQNLYTRSQLNQHINTGDSEVDGTESERGGFMGHPMCEFCLTPFYGDNELYTHMSTEHYTCHICQRQHPGQYEYYKNYDDLEIHFRRDHFLCEDEACLAKKFIVFQSEAEIKRHNTMEHGGRMSRSQRSAALQIPTSFRYRRQNEQDNRRGRGRMFRRDPTDNELSLAIQASLDIASPAPSSAPPVTDHETTDIDTFNPPFESYANTDSEVSSRYRQAVSQSAVGGALGESAFPPLAGAPGSSQQNPHHDTSSNKTMAARLRQQRNHKVKASSSGQASTPAWPAATRGPSQPLITPSRAWASNNVSGSPSSFGQSRPGIETGTASSNYSYSAQPRYPSVADSFASSLISSKTSGSTSKMSRSASAPKISESRSLEPSSADFPPVSAVQTRKPPATVEAVAKVKDVQTANKSLVEQMRGALGFDEQKFNSFKEISAEFRQSTMDAETYLVYVEQYGLSHLVPELARLLPNAQKQKELLDAYSLNQAFNASRDNGFGNGIQVRDSNNSKKGKGKAVSVNSGNNVSRNSLADDVISKAKELQSSFRPQEGEVEVLSKDGYRADRGKSKVIVDDSRVDVSGSGASTKSKNQIDLLSAAGGNGTGNGKSKQRKKTSKFHRVRLGDGSVEALLDLRNTGPDSDPGSNSNEADASSAENNPLERLLAKTSKVPRN